MLRVFTRLTLMPLLIKNGPLGVATSIRSNSFCWLFFEVVLLAHLPIRVECLPTILAALFANFKMHL